MILNAPDPYFPLVSYTAMDTSIKDKQHDEDDDHHDDDDEDHDDGDQDAKEEEEEEQREQRVVSLTGFLFGNIDKSGNLETDVLDEVRNSRAHL